MTGDGISEALQLVGHHAPQHTARLQRRQQIFHAGEPAGVVGNMPQIISIKRLLQGGQARVVRICGKRMAQHRARTVPGIRQDDFRRHGVVAMLHQRAIDRRDKIGGGIEQRAVQIEPHRLIRRAHAASLRAANK